MTQLEIGDIVMCTVEKIVGTIVFVKIDNGEQGSITLSEIAPGRIRNLRDYVVPKKVIICKVLRISGDRIDLSLRRVTPKEQKEIREKYKQEKSYSSIFKTILKDKAEKILQEIKKEEEIYEFVEEAKENPQNLEKLVGKEDSKKILEILNSQKQKTAHAKKEFNLKSLHPNGITLIKELLGKIKNSEIKYISAGKYSITAESENAKDADHKIQETLKGIETQSKKQGLEFSIKGK